MSPRRTSAHYDELLKAVGTIDGKLIEKSIRVAWTRAATASTGPDGYRSGQSFADGGTSTGTVSDSTADAALTQRERDPVAAAVQRIIDALPGFVAGADTITAQLASIFALGKLPTVPGCSVLANYGVHEPVFRNGLGRWAYEYERRHHRMPSRVEVEAHLDGKRVQ